MPSFEEQFYLENPNHWQIFKRNVRLLLWLARPALDWIVRGARIRRAYRKAQETGVPVVLEDMIDGPTE